MRKKIIFFWILFIFGCSFYGLKDVSAEGIVNTSFCPSINTIYDKDGTVTKEMGCEVKVNVLESNTNNKFDFKLEIDTESFIVNNFEFVWASQLINDFNEGYINEFNYSKNQNEISGTLSFYETDFSEELLIGFLRISVTQIAGGSSGSSDPVMTIIPSHYSYGQCKVYQRFDNIDVRHYYDQNGNYTDHLTYQKQCEKPICYKYSDGSYSGKNGEIVDEDTFNSECIDVKNYCQIIDNKYYDDEGNETTKLNYEKVCQEHYCEVLSDGTKYGLSGAIVGDLEYTKQCEKPTCQQYSDGTYSDYKGNIVTKDEFEKSCGTIENPQTGTSISIKNIILFVFIGIGCFILTKKYNRFYKMN